MKTASCLFFVLFFSAIFFVSAASPYECMSPDGRVVVTANLTQNNRLVFSVDFKNQPLLQQSNTGLAFADLTDMHENLQILDVQNSEYSNTWQRIWGKRHEVLNHYNEMLVKLQESQQPGRRLNVIFRVYNNGIALRYEIPEQTAVDSFALTADLTEYNLSQDCQGWAVNYGGFASHQ